MAADATPARLTTVLICDDNAALRSLLHAIVDVADGMRVVGEAADGETAISQASLLQPDVILLDLAMPVLSGLDALPRIRRTAPTAKIIVLSGFSTATAAERSLALGADSYLEKGTDPDTIINAIERVHARTPTHA